MCFIGSSVQHVDVAPEVNPVVQHSPAPPLVSSMLKKTSKDKVRPSISFTKNVKQIITKRIFIIKII